MMITETCVVLSRRVGRGITAKVVHGLVVPGDQFVLVDESGLLFAGAK
jgi:hypothetical protein